MDVLIFLASLTDQYIHCWHCCMSPSEFYCRLAHHPAINRRVVLNHSFPYLKPNNQKEERSVGTQSGLQVELSSYQYEQWRRKAARRGREWEQPPLGWRPRSGSSCPVWKAGRRNTCCTCPLGASAACTSDLGIERRERLSGKSSIWLVDKLLFCAPIPFPLFFAFCWLLY